MQRSPGDDERTCFSIDGDPTASHSRDLCIHQLFEAQAEKTPEATALVFEHLKLTYRELNTRANRLAHYLRSLGIGPEVLVGICVERSIEMIVGLLGILKAGGAYVPLDPRYPKERLAFMLNDTNAPVLLTHRSLLADSPPQYAGVRVCLDDELFAAQSDANLSSSATADNLAYVIYTSGSTGMPKAAMIPHRGVVRLVKNTNYADFSATHTFLQFAPIAFDASTFEIWGALLNGAKLLVFPPHTPALEDLAATLIRERITTLWLTASLFHLMVDQHLEALTHLRQLLAGGDILSVVHVRRFLAAAPACRLINGYGPTENTTFTCCYSIPRDAQITSSVPIGTPIANTQVYVLDEHGKPVSTGVPGELHAGGAGLARGYLNRPDLSAEKFIANPFSDDEDSRLYKTGDLVRRLADGNIEFLGRLDDQVKIRGFRIELGEIETVLSDHPECKQAVVIVREETSGDPTASLTTGKRLVAYVVVSGERRDELIARLRDHLKATLPDHMLPSAFVLLDKLPLTANGKIDRKALPAPDQTRPDMENFVAPRNSLESTLARIYSEVLNVEHVGVHDNFMNLGGHSLFAAQIAARVREALQIELPVRLLLEGSSVSALAARIQTSESEKYAPLMRVARHGDLPVSFSQERAWFIQQLDPTSIAYNFQATLSFTGQLDSAALERSLSEIVRRHEILRTSFPEVNGRPIQLIHHSGLVSLSTIDLQTLPGSEREAAAQRIIDLEVRKHFNLVKLPLIRWVLIRLAADEHILLQIEHHLIHDGWSFHAFLGELLELYKAFIAGKPSPLPEPAIQFADFAIAQRRWMEGEEAAAQIAYWKRKLSGAAALAWRGDRPRPPQQTFVGAAPRIELPLELCEPLRALSRRRGVTLFMTMFAGFLIVLQRYTAQTDICVGSGIANRRWRETEGLIGMIINNVVLRVDLSGDPDFRELLRRVQQTTLDAYANQDAPFDRVVRALGQARDASRNPLFEVMFSFHDSPLQNLDFPKLKTRLLSPLSNRSAKFDLNVIVIPHAEQRIGPASVEGGAGITLVWEYNSDLFDEATMTRMIGHYQNVLHGIVTDPALRISQLPLLSHAEHQQLLTAWNATGSDHPRHRTITGLFEEQVERNPEAVAVVFEDRQLTYGELNQQANRLAHHLVALGVGPEVLVGLCVERSLEMLIALLAILKAGGAYVPIDSDHPQERLAFMLEDTQVSVLITQRHLEGRLPRRPIERIYLDDLKSVTGNHPGTDPAPRAKPDNLAYVIYTSGSTGKPKGVLISHSNVHRLFSATDAWYGFSQNDVWTLFHSYAFDFSVWEIWGALLYGGRLVIVPYETSRSPDLFYELLLEQRVTVLNQTPSAFYALIEADRAYKGDRSLGLRLVIFGGEALNFAKLSHWYLCHGECTPRLVNMYGITETTVHVTYYPISAAIARETAASLIGQAIPDLSLYILDPHMNPVPIGVAGELYVGGAGLARGYLNRPQLTAEKFIPNPFSDNPAERLYKTGDLVRRLADGNIEFLGRSDDQAKIRGFRIELGEIETALSNHPKIKQAVVIAREERSGDRRLIAYVVVSGERQDKLIARLRDHLKARLPDHMLPSAFVVLDELPLTANGKVDRKALPAPNDARPELEAVYVAPRTPTEETLTAIWAEVLKLEKIGIDDNFFDLGGHSLLATQVISRVKETLDADVQLRALFESPTVAGLAAHVAQAVNEGTAAPALTSDLTALSDEALDAFILAATKP